MNYVPLLNNKRYDKYSAFEVYLLYVEVEDTPTLNEVWLAVVPLIGMLLKKEFHRLDSSMLEEFEAENISVLHEILRRKMPPINSAASFNGYIYSAIFKRTCSLLEKEVIASRVDPDVICYRRLTYATEVEPLFNEVFAKHLPTYVLHEAVRKIRFTGKEREACEFLLERLACGLTGSNGVLRTKYDIPSERVPFFVNYVNTLFRRALYELRVR